MRFVQLQFLEFISLRLALCSTGVNCFSGAAVFFGIEKFTFSESVYFDKDGGCRTSAYKKEVGWTNVAKASEETEFPEEKDKTVPPLSHSTPLCLGPTISASFASLPLSLSLYYLGYNNGRRQAALT